MGIRECILTGLTVVALATEGVAQYRSDVLAQKYDAYQTVWAKNRLHLILNQKKFSPGDTIWFKTYLLHEEGRRVRGRQLVEVNLVDKQGRSNSGIKLAVNDGIGYSQLVIPDSLAAGAYHITAHTNWMLNFEASAVFRQRIEIVTENVLVAAEAANPVIAAEGGHLIAGIRNNISICTQHPNTTAYVVNSNGEVVNKAITDSKGTCNLTVQPSKGDAYFLTMANDQTRTPFPPIEDDGLAIRLLFQPVQSDTIKVLVSVPENSSLIEKELTMLLTANGKSRQATGFTLRSEGSLVLEINTNTLPQGVNTISVLDNSGWSVAFRSFYLGGKKAVLAKIVSEATNFSPRERVRLDVYLTQRNEVPVGGEFSIRVINKGLFSDDENSLADVLFFPPWLNERMEIYSIDPDYQSSLDNHMITIPEGIPWHKVLEGTIPAPPYRVRDRIRLSGTAYYANTSEPVAGAAKIMFYLQRSEARYQTFTSKSGDFGLEILDITGDDEVFYVADPGRKAPREVTIEWDEDSIQLPPSPLYIETEATDAYAAFAQRNSLITRSYDLHTTAGAPLEGEVKDENIDFEKMTGGANYTCNIADYILFPTMEELIDEIVRPLTIRKKGKAKVVRMKSMQSQVGISDPLYVLDGSVTQNTAFFLSLKPSDLISIKIIDDPRKLSKLGIMGRNGVVIVRSKQGGLREPSTINAKTIQGLSEGLTFRGNDYSSDRYKNSPDFRTTVYWNPSVRTDQQGKATIEFLCSDDIGELGIYLDGINAEGKPFSADYYLQVIPTEKADN